MTTDDLIAALDAMANAALPPAVARLLGPSKDQTPIQIELGAFEAAIRTALPDDYRQFLLQSNGGCLDGKYCFENEEAYVNHCFPGLSKS